MKHIFKILLEGFISSLTGGWYYDARQCHFTNTVHLYLWLALFCAPLILHLTVPFSYFIWMAYSLSVGLVFVIIKLINLRMHHLYDINKAINEEALDGNAEAHTGSDEPDAEAGRSDSASEVPPDPEIISPEDQQLASIKYVKLEMPLGSECECAGPGQGSSDIAGAQAPGPVAGAAGASAATREDEYVALLKRSQSARAGGPSSSANESRTEEADTGDGAKGSARLKPVGGQGHRGGSSGGSRSIHRTASDCTSALQRLRAMHAELPSIHLTDFTPSIRDLETLDANPRRALTTAISRSRSSSQRHRRPPSVRSIGRYLVSGATPTSASTATPSGGEGRATNGEHQVERSHSLRVQQRAAVDGASRLTARRGSGVAAVAPRRTQSLRQATERPAVLPRLPPSQEVPAKSPREPEKEVPVAMSPPEEQDVGKEDEAAEEKERAGKETEEKEKVEKEETEKDKEEGEQETENENKKEEPLEPKPPAEADSASSSERSLISIYSWLFDQDSPSSHESLSLSSGEIVGYCSGDQRNPDHLELNDCIDEESLERLADELPSSVRRALDHGEAGRRQLIRLLHEMLRKALTSTSSGAFGEAEEGELEHGELEEGRGADGAELEVGTLLSETSSSQVNENTVLIPRPEPTAEAGTEGEEAGAVGGQSEGSVKVEAEVELRADSGGGSGAAADRRRLRRRNCVRNRAAGGGRRASQGGPSGEGGPPRPGSPSVPGPAAITERRGSSAFVEEPDFVTRGAEAAADGSDGATAVVAVDSFEPELSAFAHNHDDTSEGAVHYFQDENGDWMVYRFGDQHGTAMSWADYMMKCPEWALEKERSTMEESGVVARRSTRGSRGVPSSSTGTAGPGRRGRAGTPTPLWRDSLGSLYHTEGRDVDPDMIVQESDDDDGDGLFRMGEWIHGRPNQRRLLQRLRSSGGSPTPQFSRRVNLRLMERDDMPSSLQHYLANATTMNWRDRRGGSLTSLRCLAIARDSPGSRSSRQGHYKMQLLPCIKKNVKVHFGRLQLMALFDRNATLLELVLSVALAVFVGMLGGLVLNTGLYVDLSAFGLCFYIAASQYSLVKSVQPDSSSPTHGFNRITVFSRAFYFSLTGSLLLAVHHALKVTPAGPPHLKVYGILLTPHGVLASLQFGLTHIFLYSPLLFLLGFLPQANTFCTYVLEQIEIHVFGGSGTTGLLAAFISILKNLVVVAMGYGLCFVGLRSGDPQHAVFSIYCGVHLSLCYLLSRSAANPALYKGLFSGCRRSCHVSPSDGASCMAKASETSKSEAPPGPSRGTTDDAEPTATTAESSPTTEQSNHSTFDDPLPKQLRASVLARLRNDGVMMILITILGFAVHVSTAFTSLAAISRPAQWTVWVAVAWGIGLHYVVPHLRKTHPWKLLAHPLISPAHSTSICEDPSPRLIPFEKVYVWLASIERNIFIPVVTFMAMTQAAKPLVDKFGLFVAPVIISICSMKLLRNGFAITSRAYLILLFTQLAFAFDFKKLSETFLVDTFIVAIILSKGIDFVRKIQFFYVYIAPWQIAWGSAVHAFAQPFFVPHSMLLFALAFISSVFSTPFQPFLGSAIFLSSYVRPIKFWEQDYNTKRVDNTNTALSAQLDRNTGSRSENLNAIFYEHLTRSLQRSLAGDIMLGRWGDVHHGDFFVMASDELNALVHIIEVGNGYVTFQLRGLELRGTYCQQREVEILRENVGNASQCCCCEVGESCSCLGRHFICLNAAFQLRSLAWEVISDPYVVDGYSISDQSASHSIQVFELRKILMTLYVKCIIYYAVQSPSLMAWLSSPIIQQALTPLEEQGFVDLDPIFSHHLDADYDLLACGVSRSSFVTAYMEWIRFCLAKRDDLPEDLNRAPSSVLVSLCLGLSLLGRRALSEAYDNYAALVDFFLYGLHALFKGDFRVTSTKDEWVFADVDLLYKVVAPALRMGLKLHQDHFANDECLTDNQALFDSIQETIGSMVICHETDSAWRYAVLNNAPRLLALRHLVEDGTEGYRIIMLTRRHLRFRMARINPECVRGLWAGQQQELVFLRNRNSERGSIQNARQVLRNMISSSCDQPLGYPIFVSPLTTSFAGTHDLYSSVAFHEFSFGRLTGALRGLWRRLRWRCDATCAEAASGALEEMGDCGGIELQTFSVSGGPAGAGGGCPSVAITSCGGSSAVGLSSVGGGLRGPSSRSSGSTGATSGKRLQAVATLERSYSDSSREAPREAAHADSGRDPAAASSQPGALRVTISDVSHIMDSRCLKVLTWPSEEQKSRVLLAPLSSLIQASITGAEGIVLHKWTPFNRDIAQRSFTNRTIYLVKVLKYYVVVFEDGIVILDDAPPFQSGTDKSSLTLAPSVA